VPGRVRGRVLRPGEQHGRPGGFAAVADIDGQQLVDAGSGVSHLPVRIPPNQVALAHRLSEERALAAHHTQRKHKQRGKPRGLGEWLPDSAGTAPGNICAPIEGTSNGRDPPNGGSRFPCPLHCVLGSPRVLRQVRPAPLSPLVRVGQAPVKDPTFD
jgi:hypothetical protein